MVRAKPTLPARWLFVAALAALWLPLVALWRQAWRAEPELAFGWGVPILAIYLAWERSRRCPAPRLPGPGGRAAAWTVVVLGLLILLAALPILEANTLWPAAQWAGAGAAVAITLAGLALAGGMPWAAHFAFPVAFISTAHLVRGNALLAAEIVSAAGYPAVAGGNVIAVASGQVGITEACSGLRSLQAVWMAAWFLGELFRLNWPRRFGLVGAALGVALASNLARTAFLIWQAAARGMAACERWHDAAGMAELAVTFLLVSAGAVWMGWKNLTGIKTQGWAFPGGMKRRWSLVVLVGALVAEGGTQAWYLAHERGARTLVRWALTPPGPAWQPVVLPPHLREVLQYSEAEGLAWRDRQTRMQVQVFLVSWRGDDADRENPEWHDPAICLPASGATLEAVLDEITIPIGGVRVPFVGYRFAGGDGTFRVFFCYWDVVLGSARGGVRPRDLNVRARRLQRVREGRRNGDVTLLTWVLQNASDAAAVGWMQEWAPRMLQPHFSVRRGPF